MRKDYVSQVASKRRNFSVQRLLVKGLTSEFPPGANSENDQIIETLFHAKKKKHEKSLIKSLILIFFIFYLWFKEY